MDFSVVYDDARGRWYSLTLELLGRGVPSIDTALREMELRPLHRPFAELLGLEDPAAAAAQTDALYQRFLAAAAAQAPGLIDTAAGSRDFRARRVALATAAPAAAEAFRWLWSLIRPLCPPAHPAVRLVSWVEEWMLGRVIREYLVRHGWDAHSADRATALLAVAVRAEEIRTVPDANLPWETLLSDPAAESFLMVNLFSGTKWFSREALELMVECLQAMEIFGGTRRADYRRLLDLAEKAGYRWEPFLAALAPSPPAAPTSTP